ncbi:MAG TPA: CmcI family methyltransferase [Bryobacteraceae bacterium]|nr:CmcI family methyltransferase [Bryobacteraceae bacterium]
MDQSGTRRILSIDTGAGTLRANGREFPLYGKEAFDLLTREWLVLAWQQEIWTRFRWLGRQILQLPADILRLAEYIERVAPDVIIETGVYDGGSALLFASVCRMTGRGRVISIERELRAGVHEALEAAGVTVLEADSAAPATAALVRDLVRPHESVFVFLDSDHTHEHVRAELANYAPLVTTGSCLVVADTILPDLADAPCGDPSWIEDNPAAAVRDFLNANPGWEVEPVTLTYFPGGWLRRSAKNV